MLAIQRKKATKTHSKQHIRSILLLSSFCEFTHRLKIRANYSRNINYIWRYRGFSKPVIYHLHLSTRAFCSVIVYARAAEVFWWYSPKFFHLYNNNTSLNWLWREKNEKDIKFACIRICWKDKRPTNIFAWPTLHGNIYKFVHGTKNSTRINTMLFQWTNPNIISL